MDDLPCKDDLCIKTTKEVNMINVSVIDSKLLFTQLGIVLYQHNRMFRDIQIRKLKNVNCDTSSIFIYISTVNKHSQKIETEEFRKNIQHLKTAIYQDERLVAVSLYPEKRIQTHCHYNMCENPVGIELFLFGSVLSQQDTTNIESKELFIENKLDITCNTELSEIESSISIESFHISNEDWNMCVHSSDTHILNEPIRYWCVFPVHCNKYTEEKEKEIKDLFYSILSFRMKTILQIAPNVCYRIVFQHPLLNPGIHEPRIYIMEANKIVNNDVDSQYQNDDKTENCDDDDDDDDVSNIDTDGCKQRTKIYRCDRNMCEIIQYIHTLDNDDPIRNMIHVPKYLGTSKSMFGVYENWLCQPVHISGISIDNGQHTKIMYNPFHLLQSYTYRIVRSLQHTYTRVKTWIKKNKRI